MWFPCFSVNSASVVAQLTELNAEGEGEPPLPSPLSCVISFLLVVPVLNNWGNIHGYLLDSHVSL